MGLAISVGRAVRRRVGRWVAGRLHVPEPPRGIHRRDRGPSHTGRHFPGHGSLGKPVPGTRRGFMPEERVRRRRRPAWAGSRASILVRTWATATRRWDRRRGAVRRSRPASSRRRHEFLPLGVPAEEAAGSGRAGLRGRTRRRRRRSGPGRRVGRRTRRRGGRPRYRPRLRTSIRPTSGSSSPMARVASPPLAASPPRRRRSCRAAPPGACSRPCAAGPGRGAGLHHLRTGLPR